jgi:hypothetical protein
VIWAGRSSQQPRRYQVRLYDGTREVYPKRRYLAVLDFTPGVGLRTTQGQLDELLISLAAEDGGHGDKLRRYHLLVEDWTTGEFECHWAATRLDAP